MPKKLIATGRIAIGLLCFALVAGGAYAQRRGRQSGRNPYPDFQRFSFSMEGGVGLLERGQGMVDLKIEAQVGITRALRLGLGFGYMDRGSGHRGEMGREGRNRQMMGGWLGLIGNRGPAAGLDGDEAFIQDLRVLPLSLNLYYGLPLGRRFDVFMSAGGSCFFGSFESSAGHQTKNAWGGQAGLGFEYRITPRINLVAMGNYRFAEFKRLTVPQPQTRMPWLEALNTVIRRETDSLRPELARIFQNALRTIEDAVSPPAARPVDFDFNGFSFRGGLRFGI
jgi:opacity protein-like surface antigen